MIDSKKSKTVHLYSDYRRVAYLGRVPCVTRENATFRFTHDYNVGQEVNKKPIF